MIDAEILEKLSRLSEQTLAQTFNMYIPQKRAPGEEDLANAVLFLASDLSRSDHGHDFAR